MSLSLRPAWQGTARIPLEINIERTIKSNDADENPARSSPHLVPTVPKLQELPTMARELRF